MKLTFESGPSPTPPPPNPPPPTENGNFSSGLRFLGLVMRATTLSSDQGRFVYTLVQPICLPCRGTIYVRAHLHPPATATSLRYITRKSIASILVIMLHLAEASTLASNLSVTWKWLCKPFRSDIAATLQTQARSCMETGLTEGNR